MFPKLWNEIEIDLKETKSAKIFKQRVINNYLENYESRRVHRILARGGKIFFAPLTVFCPPPWNCFVQKVN